MKRIESKKFEPEPGVRAGQTYRIPLAVADYGEEEIHAVSEALRQNPHNLASSTTKNSFHIPALPTG